MKTKVVILSTLLPISLMLAACAADPEQASPAATDEKAVSTSLPASATDSSTQTESPQPTDSPTEIPTSSETPQASDLDLRFANVIAVEFEQLAGEEYRFNVTLYHDDDGEAPQYADAWQVLDLDGRV
ncbi:MAG: hypothetical protein ACLFWD_12265, partial [Anaerolineales bacterium]